jgi:hypothetical protein
MISAILRIEHMQNQAGDELQSCKFGCAKAFA